jgi:hypothetical protein
MGARTPPERLSLLGACLTLALSDGEASNVIMIVMRSTGGLPALTWAMNKQP